MDNSELDLTIDYSAIEKNAYENVLNKRGIDWDAVFPKGATSDQRYKCKLALHRGRLRAFIEMYLD